MKTAYVLINYRVNRGDKALRINNPNSRIWDAGIMLLCVISVLEAIM